MARSGRKRKQLAGAGKGPAGRQADEKAAQNGESPVKASPDGVRTEEKPERPPFSPGAYLRSGMWIYPVILLLLMALMAWIRIVPAYGNVFPSWGGGYVNVAQDDAVYQMRLVHNTLAHFPTRIMFDPFTHFPYGSTIHFGPLFTLIIAGAALVVGLGNPSPALVDMVGAYIPVLLGVLCILPVYFIGSRLFGRNAGIVAAATLALIPGQFLSRSVLGFTDHHIAEVLFSAATVAFLVFALDAAKQSGLSLEKITQKDRGSLKALGFAALAGVAFGCYMLCWPGALLLGFMLFAYFAVQSVIDHSRGQPLDYLVIAGAIMYLVPAVMVLPYSLQDTGLRLVFYSMTQPVFLFLAFAGVVVIYLVSRLIRRRRMESWTFPVTLVAIGVIGILVSYVVVPELFALIMSGFQVFTPGGGMLTVGEARSSVLDTAGKFTIGYLWASFFWTLPIAIAGMAMLAFRVLKDNRPAELLVLVWSVVMFWAMISQNRFMYYFAINAALLTGYVAVAAFRAFDSGGFMESLRAKVRGPADLGPFLSKNAGFAALMGLIGVMFLLIIVYPATSFSTGEGSLFPGGYTVAFASGNQGMGPEWYSSLTWLRDHTPDPQGTVVREDFDYAGGTYNKVFNGNGTWADYPASAYGVMSWWDYGHIITYVAHRIPNANPFQAGILENNGTEGSAKFFLSTSESDGYRNLQDMGSRYVMIDNAMATGKFYAITVWANDQEGWYATSPLQVSRGVNVSIVRDSPKYKSSMMSRLYYDDCDGMSHFRLVYESPGGYYVSTKLGDLAAFQQGYPYVPFSDQVFTPSENYTEMYNRYLTTVSPMQAGQGAEQFLYDSRPPAKYVKIYEVVKGATIRGSAPAGTSVTASVDLGIGSHNFTYRQTAVAGADGTYAMTVPYPTEAMKGGGYDYDIAPRSLYAISYGDTTKTVAVPEQAVVNGGAVDVA